MGQTQQSITINTPVGSRMEGDPQFSQYELGAKRHR